MNISYQTYTPAETDVPFNSTAAGATASFSTGTQSVVFNDGQASTQTGSGNSVSTADLSVFADGDWRQTARTPLGSPTNNIDSKTVVKLNGMEAPVEAFVRAGLLRQDGTDFTLAEVTTESPQDAIQFNPDAAVMPVEIEHAANAAVEPFEQGTYDAALANGVAVAIGEMNIEDMTAGIVMRSGMEPSDVAQRAGFVIDAFKAQADSYVTRQGLDSADLEGFYEWSKGSANKTLLKAAIQQQVYGRDMSGYKPLITKYLNDHAPDSASLRGAGLQVRSSAQGDLVYLGTSWVPVSVAAKSGLI